MISYSLVKTIHILSAAILFGTGLGIAFFQFRSWFSGNVETKYETARTTVVADYVFTATAVIIQPVSGLMLIAMSGHDPYDFWLLLSYALFILIGVCWLPVVWIQLQIRNLLGESVKSGGSVPDRYHHLMRVWCLLGAPAFISIVAIFYLMVDKPSW